MSDETTQQQAHYEPGTPEAARRPFEAIRQEDEESGFEFWSARDLYEVLGYTNWRNFKYAIEKAKVACAKSGNDPDDHFDATIKMIQTGRGARRKIEDFRLSRYACYLVVLNSDPNKEIVALGQTYFAVQARRQEQAEDLLGRLSEEQRRLFIHAQMVAQNRQLAATAQQAGVVLPEDFATFEAHGYKGLYGGLTDQDLSLRKGLSNRQQVVDYMGVEEMAANLFRATQTNAKLRRDSTANKEEANQSHFEVGHIVRKSIQEMGGDMPEELSTPTESIQQLQEREKTRQHQELTGGKSDGQSS